MLTARREILRFGLSAFGTLSLPDLLRLQAAAPKRERTAVIIVWCRGGRPVHIVNSGGKPIPGLPA